MTSAKPRTRAIVYYRPKQWTKKESEMCREWRELRWNGKEEMRKRSTGRVEEGGEGWRRREGKRRGWREEERMEREEWRGRGGEDRGGRMEEERIKKRKREEEGRKRMVTKGRMGHTGKI